MLYSNILPMKRYFKILTLLLCTLLMACEDPTANTEELKQIVADFNQKCPQTLDSETRIDGLEFKEPNTLTYKYTLLNLNVLTLDTHQFYIAMWPGLLSTIKVSAEMKKLRDNDATIEYDYRDKAGKPVYLFKIAPKDYK